MVMAKNAQACSYCEKLELLQAEFQKVKPDAMDEKTIDQQVYLVTTTEKMAIQVLGGKVAPESGDWARLVPLLATAQTYDFSNTMAEDVSAALISHKRLEAFYVEVEKLKKSGALNDSQVQSLQIAFGTAEHTIQEGTGEPPKKKK
jgi:hypothetical protein